MHSYIKIFMVFLLIFINILLVPTTVSAGLEEIVEGGASFLKRGENTSEILNTNDLRNTSNFIYNAFLGVAIIIAVVVGIILGIQFITGSIDEQVKIKEALVPYVIACVIIFGGFTIWKLVVNVGEDIEGKITEDVQITELVPVEETPSSTQILVEAIPEPEPEPGPGPTPAPTPTPTPTPTP